MSSALKPSVISGAFVNDAKCPPPPSRAQMHSVQHNGTTQIDFSTSSFHIPYGTSDQGNLFMFPSDSTYSSPSPSSKESLKTDATSNLDSKSFDSPKSKHNDKLISGYDGRIDRLSPISVIAVAGFHELSRSGTASPTTLGATGNALNLTKDQLRSFQQCGGDAMLSAINYNENDVLQEGGFEISPSSGFNSLDGLLGTNSGGSIRLPDLLDADVSQEEYMEADHDLQLSPHSFSAGADSFGDGTQFSTINDNNAMELSLQDESRSQSESASTATTTAEKAKLKSTVAVGRPLKACSPGRPGNQPCPTCGKVFSNSSALTKHKLTHSDERKYVCQLCSKAFKRQDHLNGHMLTHRNKKPFECDMDGCGKSYCDARSLRRHKENHHSGSCLTATSTVVTVPTATGQTLTVIPGISHLSLNSLHTTFTTPSILTNGTSTLADPGNGNRIQYAPPAGFSQDAAVAQLLSSVLPSAASQLQFLAFQQHPNSASHQRAPPAEVKAEKLPIVAQQAHSINSSLIMGNFSTPLPMVSKEETAPAVKTENRESSLIIRNPSPASKPPPGDNELKENEKELIENNYAPASTAFPKQETLAPPSLPSMTDFGTSLDSEGGELFPAVKKETEEMVSKEVRSATPLLQQLLASEAGVMRRELNCSGMDDSLHSHILADESWDQLSSCLSDYSSSNQGMEATQVECGLCQRKFKNVSALNGHMRLHGGYFKKEGEKQKTEPSKSDVNSSTSQTASMNVRALIEEKIFQRRSAAQQQQQQQQQQQENECDPSALFGPEGSYTLSIPDQPGLEPTAVPFQDPQVLSPDLQSSSNTMLPSSSLLDNFELVNTSPHLKQQFRVPRPVAEKHRRHSDSDHFSSRPCTETITTALADYLRRKGIAKRMARSGSDPEELYPVQRAPLQSESLPSTPTFYNWNSFSPTLPPAMPHMLPSSGSHFSFLEKDLLFSTPLSEQRSGYSGGMDQQDKECDSLADVTPFAGGDLLPHEAEFSAICGLGQSMCGGDEDMPGPPSLTSVVPSSSDQQQQQPSFEPTPSTSGFQAADDPDDDVFLSPTVLPSSPNKAKRKHRPEPLFIPPHVSTCGFTSRLRSPRLWDHSLPGVSSGYDGSKPNLSPPPYTPPPMLSPVRSGSGLFWHIISGAGNLTPKSAPITPSFLLKKSTGSASEDLLEDEEEYFDTPETDIQPHVNIGAQYQARLPRCRSSYRQEAVLLQDKADHIWDPTVLEGVPDEEVDLYLEFACCAAVPGGGRNKEYALHILQLTGGNIQDAILRLMEPEPHLPQGHPLLNYQYSETDMWTVEELETYHQALIKCDKDFFRISKEVSGKSVKQCVQFYYLWKKVCPEEYKRLRLIRHKKEQESIYNLRSKVPMDNCFDSGNEEAINEVVPEAVPELSSGCYSAERATSPVSNHKTVTTQEADVFPCKVCGKVFRKVKSRSAHMKSHRQMEERRTYAQAFFHMPPNKC